MATVIESRESLACDNIMATVIIHVPYYSQTRGYVTAIFRPTTGATP